MTLGDQTFSESVVAGVIVEVRSRPDRSDLSAKQLAKCEAKAAFLTKDEAKRMRHDLRKLNGTQLGIYQCQACHCWHFTSQKGV